MIQEAGRWAGRGSRRAGRAGKRRQGAGRACGRELGTQPVGRWERRRQGAGRTGGPSGAGARGACRRQAAGAGGTGVLALGERGRAGQAIADPRQGAAVARGAPRQRAAGARAGTAWASGAHGLGVPVRAGWECWLGQLGQFGAQCTWLSFDSVFGTIMTQYCS